MAEQIVGRRGELVALAEFLETFPASGSALLFEGDAGIGKTALWQEGSRLARERGMRVLTARATQSELQTSFATVADLFGPVLEETLSHLVSVQRRALEVAFMLREPDGPPPETRLIATALLSIVRILVADRPLLVAIDDAQWVDASSEEILRFVFRRLETEPVGVLATVRGLPAETPFELDRALAGLRRLPVAPLSVGATHQLLWGRLSLNLVRPVLVRLHEATGGNPFFALEVGRALANGTIHADGVHVVLPESLRAVVEERLGALPGQVRETLVAVAALGAPTVTLLEPLTPTAVADIELACQQRVLELDGDRIRFSHPLLAPVCYEDMPLHRRRLLHRRLAELDIDPEESARHLAIAAVGPDEEIAAALDAAGAHARARGAALASAELAERAIAMTPHDALNRINRRRITAAERCAYAGDAKRATTMLEKALASSEPGPLRAEALVCLAAVSRSTKGHRAAEALCKRAIAEPGVEGRDKVNALCALSFVAGLRGDSQRGASYAEAALELATTLGEPGLLAMSSVAVAELTFWRTGCIRRDLLDPIVTMERADRGWLPSATDARAGLAVQLGRADRHDEARDLLRELIVEGTERADPAVATLLTLLAAVEVRSGAWDEAMRLCREATEVARQIGWETVEPICRFIQVEIDAYRGDREKVRAEVGELVAIAEQLGFANAVHNLRRAVALLELSCGDADASWRQAAPGFADVGEFDEYLARLAGSVAIEALIAIGELRPAERLLALLDEHAAEADTALLPLARRCRGVLHAAQGDHAAAIATLQAAAADPDRPRGVNPFELGRTLLALGTVQRKGQRKSAARASLQRAVEIFERLGARIWLENARSELARIGGRVAHEGELSETERRIVELVVAGRRNREVAAELSLSPNTIAWNLSKVYRKLGVSSRTELAAHMAATPLA